MAATEAEIEECLADESHKIQKPEKRESRSEGSLASPDNPDPKVRQTRTTDPAKTQSILRTQRPMS
jgi:hypothetical protein